MYQASSEVTGRAFPEKHSVFQKRRCELPIKTCFGENVGLGDVQRTLTLKSFHDCMSAAASKCYFHVPPHHERINHNGSQRAGLDTHSSKSYRYL